MRAEFTYGLLAALGAAAAYGSAPIAQAIATRDAPVGRGVGVGLTARMLSRPLWLIAFTAEAAGFALEAFAFSAAPATLVAPATSLDLVVFVLLAALVLGTRWNLPGIVGAVAMTVGIATLAISLRDGELGKPASSAQLLWMVVGCVVAAALLATAGQRALSAGHSQLAAGAFSAGSGIAYGIATLATRQVGRTFTTDQPWQLLTTPTPYVLAVSSLLAISLAQRGLQTAPALTYPVTSAASAFLPVVVGVLLLSDPLPSGGSRVAFIAALLTVAAGLTLMALQLREPARPQ